MFMALNEKSRKEYYTIDLLHIFNSVWKRIWVVVVCGILGGIIGFSYASFAIAPTYSSEILLYVNNSSLSIGSASFSISSSEITAAQSLVKTYIGMLENRTTLETVIEKSGVDYTWQELSLNREMLTSRWASFSGVWRSAYFYLDGWRSL